MLNSRFKILKGQNPHTRNFLERSNQMRRLAFSFYRASLLVWITVSTVSSVLSNLWCSNWKSFLRAAGESTNFRQSLMYNKTTPRNSLFCGTLQPFLVQQNHCWCHIPVVDASHTSSDGQPPPTEVTWGSSFFSTLTRKRLAVCSLQIHDVNSNFVVIILSKKTVLPGTKSSLLGKWERAVAATQTSILYRF